jgi:hypothetical protein
MMVYLLLCHMCSRLPSLLRHSYLHPHITCALHLTTLHLHLGHSSKEKAATKLLLHMEGVSNSAMCFGSTEPHGYTHPGACIGPTHPPTTRKCLQLSLSSRASAAARTASDLVAADSFGGAITRGTVAAFSVTLPVSAHTCTIRRLPLLPYSR